MSDQDSTTEERLKKLEKLAKGNRAIVVLLIVFSPFIVFSSLYSFDAEIKAGSLDHASLKSREIQIPDEVKYLTAVLGFGGLFELNKEQLISLIIKSAKKPNNDEE